jgi:hypothetical protein
VVDSQNPPHQTTAWQLIATVPRDGRPVIFANFDVACLLTGAPHVWSGRYADDMMLECSLAAEHENGEPTHWMDQPPAPADAYRNWPEEFVTNDRQ